jgi:hypothetical protein
MVSKPIKKTQKKISFSEPVVFVSLLLVGVLARIPFLKNFDLVAYDGTYYINQAKSFLGQSAATGSFPIGYPALIALFLPVVRDGVRAAQVVSVLAGIGSVCCSTCSLADMCRDCMRFSPLFFSSRRRFFSVSR